MSSVTIFVVIKDGVALAVAHSTEVTAAVNELQWCMGELYACRVSESAAVDIRQAILAPPGSTGRSAAPSALTLLKRYSQSMQKCADVT